MGPMSHMPMQPSPGAGKGGMGGAFQKARDSGLFNRMAMGFNSMRLNPDPVLQASLGRRETERRALGRQEQMGNKTADYLESIGMKQEADMVRSNPQLGMTMLRAAQEARLQASMRPSYTPVRGSQLGLTGPDAEKLFNVGSDGKITAAGGGGVTIQNEGTIPPNYRRVVNPETGEVSVEPIPGSPAAMEIAENLKKEENRQATRAVQAATVIQDLQRMYNTLDEFAVGDSESYVGKVGGAVSRSVLAKIPGTPEYAAARFKDSALSNIGLDTLAQVKQNSPTGGGLGPVPIQQQQRLEQVLGSLDLEQDLPIVRDNINRTINIYNDIVHGTRSQRLEALNEGKITQEQFDAVESLYKPLTFDAQGNPINTSNPPPDFPRDVDWSRVPDAVKLQAWNRYNTRTNGYVGQ